MKKHIGEGWTFTRDEHGGVHIQKTKSETNGEIVAVTYMTADQWDALVAELAVKKPAPAGEAAAAAEGEGASTEGPKTEVAAATGAASSRRGGRGGHGRNKPAKKPAPDAA